MFFFSLETSIAVLHNTCKNSNCDLSKVNDVFFCQIEYTNHKKFLNKTKDGRKFTSPIRFFTNLPLQTIDLSNDSNYKMCNKCKFYVSTSNNHCHKCGECTSKNGMTYKHCDLCKRCVKPTFFHCKTCGRCSQQKNHVCGVVVESQVRVDSVLLCCLSSVIKAVGYVLYFPNIICNVHVVANWLY